MRALTVLFVFTLACGSTEPVDVISSTLTASADGATIDPVYGVANTLDSGTVSIAAGSGELNCGSQKSPNPPGSGIYLNIQIPVAVVGVPDEHVVRFFTIDGDNFSSIGSGAGTLEVTAVTEESIAVTVNYDEDLNGAIYQASGSLEVVFCD